MTLNRHFKEKEKWKAIQAILSSKYDNDPRMIRSAERDYANKVKTIRLLRKASTILASIGVQAEGSADSKTTIIDLKTKELSLSYPNVSSALLAYSLDTVAQRKIFPMTISNLFTMNVSQDIRKHNKSDITRDLKDLYTFFRNFYSRYNITVSKIQKDANKGTIQFETMQTDQMFGATRQYITISLEKYKQFEFKDFSGDIVTLAKDYKSLFSYFALFGFSEIYARCTCRNYLRKYNKKLGMQNYFCPHIMYSLSMFPAYAVTVLSK